MTKARSPADIVSFLPYRLGFQPTDSIVLIGLEEPRRRVGPIMRLDLPAPGDRDALVDYLLWLAARHRFAEVMVVVFSHDERATAAIAVPLLGRLSEAGVVVVEALRATEDRWWSLSCAQEACCPAAGRPYDPHQSPAVAGAVVAGYTKEASRDVVRQRFAPAPESVRAAVERLCAEQLETSRGADPAWMRSAVRLAVDAALGADALDDERLGLLLGLVQGPYGRDAAWVMMTRDTAPEHLALWSAVTRAAPDTYLPAAGSLAGFAAWISGEGAQATLAAERVLSVDPSYSMANLLLDILSTGTDSRIWEQIACSMAP